MSAPVLGAALVFGVAHATSLLVIVPTAASGLWTYQRSRLVDWSVVLPMAGGAVVAAVAGALLAERLPPSSSRRPTGSSSS